MNNKTFFNLEIELKKFNINIDEGAGIACFVSLRGTGKTTSALKSVINKCIKLSRQFILMRSTQVELLKFAKIIESLPNLKLYDDQIWLIKTEQEKDKTKIIKERLIGFLVNLSSAAKFKSAFENDGDKFNICYIMYDEFNAVYVRDGLYEEFTNIITTIKRNQPNFWIIMLGNKDNQNNPFLVDWGIRFKNELKELYYLNLYDEYGVHYIEYPKGHFLNYEKTDNFISKVASANEEMDRFMNQGGFRKEGIDNIIKYKKWIQPHIIKKWFNIFIRRECYEVGLFNDDFLNKQNCLYIHNIEFKRRDQSLPTIAFSQASSIAIKGVENMDEQDGYDLAELIDAYGKTDKLYFTSFNAFLIVLQEVYIQIKYNNQN